MASLASAEECNMKDLRVVTWNVAAVNNNPLEYWTTYDAPAYTQLMEDMEAMIESPGDRDVPLSSFFSSEAMEELLGLMRGVGWEGCDEVAEMWNSDLSKRPLVSGFLKDKALGAKRFMSMPDRFTNTVNVANSEVAACRPSVINNYVGDLSTFEAWWAEWKRFMFEAPLVVSTKAKGGEASQVPYQMLGPIPRNKYPALSEEEERVSLPLQTVCLALFDASLLHLMNTLSPSGEWLAIKRRLCDALFVNKQARTLEILSSPRYRQADVVFLQEVAASFVPKLQAALEETHQVLAPLKLDAKRDQNSVIALRKASFPPPSEAGGAAGGGAGGGAQPAAGWTEVTDVVRAAVAGGAGVMDGDLVAALARDRSGQEFLLASFHGDTNGIQSIPVLEGFMAASKASFPTATVLFGLDANVYELEGKGVRHVSDWVEAFTKLGLTSNWGAAAGRDLLATRTTFNARTYVQPQLQKAVKKAEFFKGDVNPKDYVLFSPSALQVKVGGLTERDNTGDGGGGGELSPPYADTPIPSLVWPSDHSAVLFTASKI